MIVMPIPWRPSTGSGTTILALGTEILALGSPSRHDLLWRRIMIFTLILSVILAFGLDWACMILSGGTIHGLINLSLIHI